MENRFAVTGHRPETLGDIGQNTILKIQEAIDWFVGRKSPLTEWNIGGARGVDTWVAESALKYGHKIYLYLPFSESVMWAKWDEQDREKLRHLVQHASGVKRYSKTYNSKMYGVRDKAMVDESERLFAVWNGMRKGGTFLTVKYAASKERHGTVLNPRSLLFFGGSVSDIFGSYS